LLDLSNNADLYRFHLYQYQLILTVNINSLVSISICICEAIVPSFLLLAPRALRSRVTLHVAPLPKCRWKFKFDGDHLSLPSACIHHLSFLSLTREG
jgi:hypothetical protein